MKRFGLNQEDAQVSSKSRKS